MHVEPPHHRSADNRQPQSQLAKPLRQQRVEDDSDDKYRTESVARPDVGARQIVPRWRNLPLKQSERNKEKSHKLTDIGLATMRPTQSTRTRWENVG